MTATSPTPVTGQTFIKVTEVWIPDRSRRQLEFHSGIYGQREAFRQLSENQRFAYGEGLPGAAWKLRRPIVLSHFDEHNFKRTEAAHAAGLTCGIAFPVFAGEFLTGVVVFLCGDDEANAGAIEVWGRDPADSLGLRLTDGYYGKLNQFEFISRHTSFRRGSGLPGQVWAQHMPVIMQDLGNSGLFSRSLDASRAGITTALGLPCSGSPDELFILCLLSVREMPIARRYEIWVPNDERRVLRLLSAADETASGDHIAHLRDARIARGIGIIGQVWRTGVPQIASSLADDPSTAAASARIAGLDHVVAVPIVEQGILKAVVSWYF